MWGHASQRRQRKARSTFTRCRDARVYERDPGIPWRGLRGLLWWRLTGVVAARSLSLQGLEGQSLPLQSLQAQSGTTLRRSKFDLASPLRTNFALTLQKRPVRTKTPRRRPLRVLQQNKLTADHPKRTQHTAKRRTGQTWVPSIPNWADFRDP